MANERGNFIYNNARLALQKEYRQEHILLRQKVRPYFEGENARWYAYSYAITLLTERHRGDYSRLVNHFREIYDSGHREDYAKRTVLSSKGSRIKVSGRVPLSLPRTKRKSRKE